MLGIRGDRLAMLLAAVGVGASAALGAFVISGWKATALWIVSGVCLVVVAFVAVRARMSFKYNIINIQHLGKVGTAVKIDLGANGEFSENEMKVKVAEAGKLLDVSGAGKVQGNKFDLAAGKVDPET
jgi:hypothetical protein